MSYNANDLEVIMADVDKEFCDATEEYLPFNSAHEGWAVLKEEVDELWEEVRAKQGERDPEALYHEAIQVAAMAIRFAHDICAGNSAQR